MSSWVKAEVNCGPLSEITLEWRLNQGKILVKKSLATPAASMFFVQGQ